jgi:hypothetical protein
LVELERNGKMPQKRLVFIDGPIDELNLDVIDAIFSYYEDYTGYKIKAFSPNMFIDKMTYNNTSNPLNYLIDCYAEMLDTVLYEEGDKDTDIIIFNRHFPNLFINNYILFRGEINLDKITNFSSFLDLVEKYKAVIRSEQSVSIYTGINFDDDCDCTKKLKAIKYKDGKGNVTFEDIEVTYEYKKYYPIYRSIFVGDNKDFYVTEDTVLNDDFVINAIGF